MRLFVLSLGFLWMGIGSGCKPVHQGEDRPEVEKRARATPEVKKPKTSDSIECSWQGDRRQILNRERSQGGCEVVYTKGDESKTVAEARNDLAYCERVALRVKSNLEQAGFNCDDAR